MRTSLYFCIAVILCAPILASAADNIPNGLKKSICKNPIEPKWSGALMNKQEGEQASAQLLGSSNFCTNETISLGGMLGNFLKDEMVCICTTKAELDKVGCSAGQIQPTVTTVIEKEKSGCLTDSVTVSKCVADPEAAYRQACGSGVDIPRVTSNTTPGTQTSGANATFGTQQETPTINRGTIGGSEEITKAFSPDLRQAAAGAINSPNEQERVELLKRIGATETSDSENNKTMLRCIANGCSKAEYDSASGKVGFALNEDTKTKISSLTPAELSSYAANNPPPGTPGAPGSQSTFGAGSNGPAGPNIGQNLTPMCGQEGMGGCGYEYACAGRETTSMACRTNNPGALACSNIDTTKCADVIKRFGGYPCGQTNNTACFPSVEQGIAAQAQLLATSNRYYANGNRTILEAICNGYAQANCSNYATFVAAQAGIPLNQTIDPKNAQQMGAILMAQSRWENGRAVMYTPEQLQKGLEMAYNGAPPSGTPGYTPSFNAGTAGGVQFGSPFGVTGYAPAGISGMGSPFQNTNPLSSFTSLFSGGSSAQPPVSTAINPNNPLPTAQPNQSIALPQPVATILVQPRDVLKGKSVLVSWSSVGMRLDQPCRAFVGTGSSETLIAQAPEGSRTVTATSTGTLSFSLRCTSSAGLPIQQATTVNVR